jgi:hypothetical protein
MDTLELKEIVREAVQEALGQKESFIPPTVTEEQACEILHTSVTGLKKMQHRGQIKPIRKHMKKGALYWRSDIEGLLNKPREKV